MRYRFRSIPPNADIILDHSGAGYIADDPDLAWVQLSQVLTPQTVAGLQRRYTIEEIQ